MSNIYDVVIVGGGPAGMSAAIYSSRMKLRTIILEKNLLGGQMLETHIIDNYLGAFSTNSFELVEKMAKDAVSYGAEVKEFTEVVSVNKENELFIIKTKDEVYYSKTVIFATGTKHNVLSIKNHDEFLSRGIHYCVVCDAPFYKDKTVAVIGGGDSALEAVDLLSSWAKKVYLIHRRKELRAKPSLIENVLNKENIEFILENEVEDFLIENDTFTGVVLKDNRELFVNGIFPCIGSKPVYSYIDSRILKSSTEKEGYLIPGLKEDRKEKFFEDYSLKNGAFLIGDAAHPKHKQVSIAVSDGAVAGLEAYEYIKENFK